MKLTCPQCRAPLERRSRDADATWNCPECKSAYPERHGVVCFLDRPDDFYEGRFPGTQCRLEPHTFWGRLALPLRLALSIDLRWPALLRRRLGGSSARVLDLGCGGGNHEIANRDAREIIGVDLSRASLRNALAVYGHAVQASATRLPFADEYFDAVVSSNFLGHVPFEEKDAVYHEMTRVLRPGGLMLHQLETSSEGPIFRYARRRPDYYQKQLVDLDGHVGLELPRAALERFRQSGLEVEWARGEFVWYFLPQGEYLKRFDNDYGRANRLMRCMLWIERLLERRDRARKLANLLLGAANDSLYCLTPMNRAIGLCAALRKPDASCKKKEDHNG